jgi:hypothetical protein
MTNTYSGLTSALYPGPLLRPRYFRPRYFDPVISTPLFFWLEPFR